MDIENWYQQRLDTLKMIDHEPEAADD